MSAPERRREQEVARALRRAGMYRVLGGAFAYPTAPRIADLARSAATLAVNSPAGPLRDALARFAAAAFNTDADNAAGEYVFLFDREVRCPAYEGAWGGALEMAGRVARLADVAGFYGAFGLEPAGAQPESEDHLVPELEFMSALALKEAWAIEAGDAEREVVTREAATAFMTAHLGRWAPRFAAEAASATAIPYYTTAAALLAEWIESEIAALGATPDPVGARDGVDPVQDERFSCPMAPEANEAIAPET
jgi:TorA maturation chaperone TorD